MKGHGSSLEQTYSISHSSVQQLCKILSSAPRFIIGTQKRIKVNFRHILRQLVTPSSHSICICNLFVFFLQEMLTSIVNLSETEAKFSPITSRKKVIDRSPKSNKMVGSRTFDVVITCLSPYPFIIFPLSLMRITKKKCDKKKTEIRRRRREKTKVFWNTFNLLMRRNK